MPALSTRLLSVGVAAAIALAATASHAAPSRTELGFRVDGQVGRLVVTAVAPSGPAAAAGLRVGDVVVAYRDYSRFWQPTWPMTAEELGKFLESSRITVGVYREGTEGIVEVAVAKGPVPLAEASAEPPAPWTVGPAGRHYLGVGLVPTTELASCAGENDCVVLARVLPGSPAAVEGVEPGDRLVRIGAERLADDVARYGEDGLVRHLRTIRSSERWEQQKIRVGLFRPGVGAYDSELSVTIVHDPVTAPPPRCQLDVDALQRPLRGLRPTETLAALAPLDAQVEAKAACMKTAPTEHQPALQAQIDAARKLLGDKRAELERWVSLVRQDGCPMSLLYDRTGVSPRDTWIDGLGRLLACRHPGKGSDSYGWVAAALLGYGEHVGANPAELALALNLFFREVHPGADQPLGDFARKLGAHLARSVAGVSDEAMKAAVEARFQAEDASRLLAGAAAARALIADLRDADVDAVWAAHEADMKAVSAAGVPLTDLRARLTAGASAALLPELDALRIDLLARAKGDGQAISEPPFAALTTLARAAVPRADTFTRPWEIELPTARTMTERLGERARTPGQHKADPAFEPFERGAGAARLDAFGPSRPPYELHRFTLRISGVAKGKGGYVIKLNHKVKVEYEGSCQDKIVGEYKGNVYGREVCSAGSSQVEDIGPPSVTVAPELVGAAKAGRGLEFLSSGQDDAEGWPVLVVDTRDKIHSLGPFVFKKPIPLKAIQGNNPSIWR